MDPFILTIALRGLIATALAAGGLYALNRGYNLFLNKVGLKTDETVIILGKTRISVKSVGALLMVTASFWGYLSLQCAPRAEGDRIKVANQRDAEAELARLRAAITRALLVSQDAPVRQKVFQATLATTLNEALLPSTRTQRAETEYTYDSAGNLTSIVGDRPTTTFTYDALGRLTKVTQPNTGNSVSYIYDAVDNRLAATDADGIKSQYEYDSEGRILRVTTVRKINP